QILKHDPNNEEVQMWFKLFKLAHRMKEEGDEAYKNDLLDEAIDKYTQCIHADQCNNGFNSAVYCNRDAEKACQLDSQCKCALPFFFTLETLKSEIEKRNKKIFKLFYFYNIFLL
ncbi:hypothetical protein RFI_37758, partial [Reticulomyxa filosa]